MPNGKVGAQLFTCRKYTRTIKDIAETFEKISGIGYTAVQISAFGPVDPKEVARIVDDSGLTVAATHVGWPRCLNELDATIEEHKMWNCAHPAVGCLPGEYCSEGADGVKRFLDELAPVAEKLAAEGMDFSYHNHSHELVRCGPDGETWLELLYSQAAPDVLKAEIDTYWIQHGGADPAVWVAKCAGREPLLHLKDMCITPEREQRMAEIGEGNLNWPAILAEADKAGVQWYLVEQDDCYDRDPFESLAISYRNLVNMGLN